MQVFAGWSRLRGDMAPTAVTLGNFDGVHRGHQTLIDRVSMLAAQRDLRATVVTFEPLPREYFAPEQAPPRLYCLARKLEALRAVGAEQVVVLPFDARLAATDADSFVQRLICADLNAKVVVIGDDWRFGKGRRGDFALLSRHADAGAFALERAPTFSLEGGRVSSTRIRTALGRGDTLLAERLLGRPYAVRGRVVRGAQLGTQLGTPTANVITRIALPLRWGVYCAWLNGTPAIANFGCRPTVDGAAPLLEVHLLQDGRDLYNSRVEVTFGAYLRAEQSFSGLDALKAQIQQDVEQARHWHHTHSAES